MREPETELTAAALTEMQTCTTLEPRQEDPAVPCADQQTQELDLQHVLAAEQASEGLPISAVEDRSDQDQAALSASLPVVTEGQTDHQNLPEAGPAASVVAHPHIQFATQPPYTGPQTEDLLKVFQQQVSQGACLHQLAQAAHIGRPKLPRPSEPVDCPRCSSADTKFCYYNNYNIKQPRYYCKVLAHPQRT